MKTFVEIGAGKGLGNAVARKFAENGYRVILIARSKEHLQEHKSEFERLGYEADICVADAADPISFQKILEDLKEKYPDILTIHYNVGITGPDSDYPMNEKLMAERYQVDVLGAYQVIQTFADETFADKGGSILVTGGGFAMYPMTAYLPLSMDKAALRAMVLAEHNEWQDKGLFIGTVTVTNAIGYAKGYEPDTIAEKFWELYCNRDNEEIIY